jgi:apolipoprotein N-acyltransferase
MAFEVNYRRVAESVFVIVLSAVAIWFGNGLDPLWPLMWLAVVPVLVFALYSPWWVAALTAATAMLIGNLNMWHYFIDVLHAPISAWFSVFSVVSVIFALAVSLFRALALRGATWSALVVLPAVWVSVEYLRNLMTPHGTAGSLAYSQLRFLPFLQLASITGPWGMTFLLLLFPSAVALGWYQLKRTPRQAARVAGVGLGAVGLVLLFGAVRLVMPEGQMVRVGLIASDEKENNTVVGPGKDTERLFRDYATAGQELTARGAQVVVIPEKVGVTLEGKSADTDAVMQSLAEKTGATVVAGVVHVDTPVKYNEARVYEPGSAVRRYDKQHMLPPFESNLKPGTALTLLSKEKQAPNQVWGVAICKDMDFASPSQSYGKAGAGLLLVPAWDFVVDRSWHGHIAVMRGVENGFSIARAAKNGYLTVSDNRGRVLGETRSDSAPFATLLVDVPASHRSTVYQVMGDWFAWVSIALFVFVLVRGMKLRRHAQA